MRRKKDFKHRILALVLAFVLTVSMGSGTSLNAFANEGTSEEEISAALEIASEDAALEDAEDALDEDGGIEPGIEEEADTPEDGNEAADPSDERKELPDEPEAEPNDGEADGEDIAPAADDAGESSDDAKEPSEDETEGEDAEAEEDVEEAAEDELLKEGKTYKIVVVNENGYGEEGADLDILDVASVKVGEEEVERSLDDGSFYVPAAAAEATSLTATITFAPKEGFKAFAYQIDASGSAVAYRDTEGTEDKAGKLSPVLFSENEEYTITFSDGNVPKAGGTITINVKAALLAKFCVFTNNIDGDQDMLSITALRYTVTGQPAVNLVNSADWASQLVDDGNKKIEDYGDEGFYTLIPLGEEVFIDKSSIKVWWDDDALAQEYTGFTIPELFTENGSRLINEEDFYDNTAQFVKFTLDYSDLDGGGYANFRIEGRPITQFYFDNDQGIKFELVEPTKFHYIDDTDGEKWYVAPRSLDSENLFRFTASMADTEDYNHDVEYCYYELQRFSGPEPGTEDPDPDATEQDEEYGPETYATGVCDRGDSYGEFNVNYTTVHSLVQNGTNLVKICAKTRKYNNVNIVVPKNKVDVTVRSGAQLLDADYHDEGDERVYHVAVDDNTQLIVTARSNDYANITGVKVQDSKHPALSNVSVSKTGEYTVAVGDKDARLEVYADPVLAIVVKDIDSDELLEPVNGQFFVQSGHKVVAYLADDASGNKYVKAESEKIYYSAGDITHTEDNDSIGMEWVKNKGISGYVWFELGGKEYRAKISFETDITEITVAGEKNGAITVPFGTDYSTKVTVKDAKADAGRISVFITDDKGVIQKDGDDRYIDFGYFDGSAINVCGDDVINHYDCNEGDATVYYGFFVDGDTMIGGVHKLVLTNQIKGKKPVVKESVNDATLHDIGLSLSVPKEIDKSAEGLFYKVVATASEGDITRDEEWEPWEEEREYYSKETGDANQNFKTNLNYWDDSKHCLVERYKAEVTAFVPATKTNASVRVALEGNPYDAWQVRYDVTVSLVYAVDPDTIKGSGLEADPVQCATRSQCYETKLTLIKEAPAKIYSGENNVPVAMPKFSAATTMRQLDHVTILDSAGRAWGSFYADDENKWDNLRWIYFEEDTNRIFLNTAHKEEDGNWDYLQGGKYTIVAYARAGSGTSATASMTVTVCNPIAGLEITPASSSVLKTYNKAATLKTSVAYRGLYDDPRRDPDTKKVTYIIAKSIDVDPEGYLTGYEEFDLGDPLFGKISVNQKNGTVTIDKSYLVSGDYYGNRFYVVVKAADYPDNDVYGYSWPIEISSVARIPTTIKLMHLDDRYDDDGEYHIDGEQDSEIEDGDKNVNTGSASYVTPYVYDQFYNRIYPEDYTIKATGFTSTWDGKLVVNKPGKHTITVTAKDGSKKSTKLQFTTVYCSKDYYMDVMFQDGSRDWGNYDESFRAWDDNNRAENVYSSPTPVYISVCGAWDHTWDEWRDTSLIKHSVKVKGGKILRTDYGMCDVSTTYTIVPTAYETVITVTDKTAGRAAADKTKTYTVVNSAYADKANTKAVKLTADKKSIISGFDMDESALVDGGYSNPNDVTFTAASLPAGTNTAVITMDDPGDDVNKCEFMKDLAGTNDDEFAWQLCRGGIRRELNADKKSITITFYQIDEWESEEEGEDVQRHYRTGDIKPGSYTFYVTFGKYTEASGDDPDSFVATAAPTKVSIKVAKAPTPKASFTTTKITFSSKNALTFKFKVPSVSNGFGISSYCGLRGALNKGIENDFTRLIDFERDEDGREELGADGCYTLRLDPYSYCEVILGKSKEHRSVPFNMMWKLKQGKLDDFGVEDFTAAEQKAAYKEWLKNNKTGYFNYEMIRLDGSYTNYADQKLTIDLEKCIDSFAN